MPVSMCQYQICPVGYPNSAWETLLVGQTNLTSCPRSGLEEDQLSALYVSAEMYWRMVTGRAI